MSGAEKNDKHAEKRNQDSTWLQDEPLAQLAHFQRVALIGQLAAEMTHEIRQPLAAIRNFSEAAINHLRSEPFDREEIENALATIFVQAGRAQQITRRVTSYVREAAVPLSDVCLPDLIGGVLPLVDFEADRRHVDLVVEADPELPSLRANPIEIEQVLVNLLRNAIESVAGRENDHPRRVCVRASCHEGMIKIEVADTGLGIAAEHADHLFEKFFTTKPEGLGLGLAVSRELVQKLGGRLWAIPNQDGGATFCFTLPLTD